MVGWGNALRSVGRLAIVAWLVGLSVLCWTAAASATATGKPAPADCGATTSPFAQWGDSGQYYFPGNAGFESGSSGWLLTGGASVVSGNESYFAHDPSDSHSLLIPAGGSATASVCIDKFSPGLRVFAVGNGATITVSLSASGPNSPSKVDGGSFTAGSSWAPSPLISTGASSATSNASGHTVQVQISVSGAAAQIDDLYVDPFALRR